MQYFIGIDGRASKTQVWCANKEGQILGESISGPTNLSSVDHQNAKDNLKEAIKTAISNLPDSGNIERAVFGLSGFDTPEEQVVAREIFASVFAEIGVLSWTIVNDSLIALESGAQNPNKIVLISGTGSNCLGKNENGDIAHVGGMDFLLSDEGSGYDIGRKVLRQAVRSFDQRDKKTILEDLVCRHFKIESIAQLKTKVYNPLISKKEIALLAPLAFEAKKNGDEIASKIISQSVVNLLKMVSTVVDKLDLSNLYFDLVLVGGIISKAEMHVIFIDQVKKLYPKSNVILPDQPPVFGAIKLAIK